MSKRLLFYLFIVFAGMLYSCKSAKLSDAVAKEEKGEYFEAAQIYRRVWRKTKSKEVYLRSSIAYHMGDCYRRVNNTSAAHSAFSNAIRYEYPDSTAHLYRAQMSHKLGKYKDASKQYQEFLEFSPNNTIAINGIIGCDSAQVWKSAPGRYIIKKMDKFNSRDGEFSPILLGPDYDQLYFNSGRKDAIGEEKSLITGVKNNDFFLVKQDEKKQWLSPEVIESGVNTEFDEGAGSFTPDGSQMYYTYCSEDIEADRSAKIYVSNRSGAQWGAGTEVQIFKDSLAMAAHPAVGPDGYLYFVSDIHGGYGGKDLWRIRIADIGITYPENLGPDINTPADELFPHMREDTTLFFSSNGHPGMGGLDIFQAKQTDEYKWDVSNMKHPINSNADDFGIYFAGMKGWGFFSSNRNESRGTDHIYYFEMPPINVFVEGWVLNKEEEDIENAKVRIVGKDGTNQQIFVRADGTYYMEVAQGMEYTMMASAPGYLNQRMTLDVPIEEKSETFYVDFFLNSISNPEVVENIFYDFDKATLRPESKEALDELIIMMEDNPNITIEMAAHTDRKGTEEYNINLSQRRAQSVVDYLIEGGVVEDRLSAKGYGKTKPKTVTKLIAEKYDFLPEGQILDLEFVDKLTPEQQTVADQINRRTEFQVLSTEYGLY